MNLLVKNFKSLISKDNDVKIIFSGRRENLSIEVNNAIDEIEKLISRYYDGDYNRNFYVFNLLGYGSIMMSSNPRNLENIELVQREIMESKALKKI